MPELMAHRGNSALAPENTLAAFAKALESKAESCELDVHLSADGELIVMHDATVDRTTNGSGQISQMTLRQLKALDAGSWFAPEFAGEPVPTLAEVVALVGNRIRLNVEIKAVADPGSSLKVVETLRDGGILEQSMISSFGLGALLETRRHWPDGTLALITGRGSDLQIAIDNEMQWFNLYYHEATPALVQTAHDAGLKVMIWTMDDPALWETYSRMNVDGICTNAPHLMPV